MFVDLFFLLYDLWSLLREFILLEVVYVTITDVTLQNSCNHAHKSHCGASTHPIGVKFCWTVHK